jgi:hypothetical protein
MLTMNISANRGMGNQGSDCVVEPKDQADARQRRVSDCSKANPGGDQEEFAHARLLISKLKLVHST